MLPSFFSFLFLETFIRIKKTSKRISNAQLLAGAVGDHEEHISVSEEDDLRLLAV